MADADYEYKGKMHVDCSYDESKGLISANGITIMHHATPYAMQAALALGPISAVLDASSKPFKNYGGGIFDHDDCGV